MSLRTAVCGLLLFCLCACSAGTASDLAMVTSTSDAQVSPSIAADEYTVTPTSTPAPTPMPVDRPLYEIQALLDTHLSSDGMMSLAVQEQVTYTNRSAESIGELILQFEPARQTELFTLESLSSDRASQTAPATIDSGQLHVPLETPLAPGETTVLRLEYRRSVAQENTLIGWNEYQIVLGNWYAFYPPYRDGKGWLAHAPGKVGEHLSFAYADFDIRLDIQSDSTYWVAASGISQEGEMPLHFLFTGRSFAVALTTQIPFRRMTSTNVEVIGYAQPQYEEHGDFLTGIAAKSVEIYTERYGSYPHPRLTVLESELPDGMEFDGLVFLNPDLFPYYKGHGSDYLTTITAHETAHQWWYGRVANDQAIDPWLDEAFAAYSELFFYERAYPSLVEWWWWTRVQRYPSTQCVDLPIYQFAVFRDYVNTVYLRGVTMLHALRKRMGNQAFEESLRELQSAYYGSVISSEDVFRVFQSHSAVPLYSIWDEYLCIPPPHV